MKQALVVKMPRWVKWNVGGKVGGFLAGAFFAVAVDMVFSAIFGSIKKSELQGYIRESLDCRFYSMKAKIINEITVTCFTRIKGIL